MAARLAEEDRELIRECVEERARIDRRIAALRDEIERLREDKKQLSNASLAEKFECGTSLVGLIARSID